MKNIKYKMKLIETENPDCYLAEDEDTPIRMQWMQNTKNNKENTEYKLNQNARMMTLPLEFNLLQR